MSDRLLGALEEDVGDLDLGRAQRLGDRERVDRPLDLVAAGALGRARRRRGGRSCSRRPAAARLALDQQVDRAAQDGAADPEQDRHLGPARARRRRSARAKRRSRARRGPAPAAPSASAPLGVEPRPTPRCRRDQLRRGLAPPVRLAPLEQRVDGRCPAPSAPPAPRAPSPSAERPRRSASVAAPCRSGSAHSLVGGDRGVGEGAAGAVAGRRPTSGGGPSPSSRRRRPARGARRSAPRARSGEGRLTPDRDLGRLEAQPPAPGAAPAAATAIAESSLAVDLEARRRGARSPASRASAREPGSG